MLSFQTIVSLLPWIIIGCALFLLLYFVLDIRMRLIMALYSLTIRYYLWRAHRELGSTLTYQDLMKEEED